jgi:hypothetical protein
MTATTTTSRKRPTLRVITSPERQTAFEASVRLNALLSKARALQQELTQTLHEIGTEVDRVREQLGFDHRKIDNTRFGREDTFRF